VLPADIAVRLAHYAASHTSGHFVEMPIPPMLELKLSRSVVSMRHAELGTLAESIELLRTKCGNRSAIELLLNVIGTTPNPNLDDAYYSEALDYHLAHLYAHLGQLDKAGEHLDRSNTHPHRGGDLIFSDQAAEGLALREQQRDAIARGLPALLIASMPRSASASLIQTIQAALKLPIMRLSLGSFPRYALMRRWLVLFHEGGAVTHDHFGASDYNLKTLIDANVPHVFVLARDPRAAAASALKLGERHGEHALNAKEFGDALVEYSLHLFTPWLAGWLEAEHRSEGKLVVHWIDSSEVRSNLSRAVRRIVDLFAETHPSAVSMLMSGSPEVRANFVEGNDDAWRSFVDDGARERMWLAIPHRARELLQLAP
jgi:hypothetical protein